MSTACVTEPGATSTALVTFASGVPTPKPAPTLMVAGRRADRRTRALEEVGRLVDLRRVAGGGGRALRSVRAVPLVPGRHDAPVGEQQGGRVVGAALEPAPAPGATGRSPGPRARPASARRRRRGAASRRRCRAPPRRPPRPSSRPAAARCWRARGRRSGAGRSASRGRAGPRRRPRWSRSRAISSSEVLPPRAMILVEPPVPPGSGTAVPHTRRLVICGAGSHQSVDVPVQFFRNQVWCCCGPTTRALPEGMANMCG